jgi:phosphoribosylanthranilate isomerase
MSTWIKICGTTNLEDARASVDAGANALGFIFAPSPRRISPKDARRIIAELPDEIEKIGVFVNQIPDLIADTIETAGLTGIQLHGDEDAEFVRQLRRVARLAKIYKVLPMRVASNAAAADVLDFADAGITALLLDSAADGKRGGSGRMFDWDDAAPLVQLLGRKFKIVVAGGLTSANVGKAIATFHPYGVDVVSGVERDPGKKDTEKIRAFIAAVRAAEQP